MANSNEGLPAFVGPEFVDVSGSVVEYEWGTLHVAPRYDLMMYGGLPVVPEREYHLSPDRPGNATDVFLLDSRNTPNGMASTYLDEFGVTVWHAAKQHEAGVTIGLAFDHDEPTLKRRALRRTYWGEYTDEERASNELIVGTESAMSLDQRLVQEKAHLLCVTLGEVAIEPLTAYMRKLLNKDSRSEAIERVVTRTLGAAGLEGLALAGTTFASVSPMPVTAAIIGGEAGVLVANSWRYRKARAANAIIAPDLAVKKAIQIVGSLHGTLCNNAQQKQATT